MNTQIETIFDTARKAQAIWAQTSFRKRKEILINAQKYVLHHKEEIVNTICKDNGKTKIGALATEVLPVIMSIPFYIKKSKTLLKPQKLRGGNIALFNKKPYILREPWGIVGIISPWNYPFSIPFSEIVMALLMGNAVILKVASATPNVGTFIKKCFTSIGLPEGLFTLLELKGKEAGDALIEHRVDKLFFTGSVPVGKALMKKASDSLIPVVLELGGNDAALVLSDADMELTTQGIIWAAFSNAGQSCAGIQRVLVHQTMYEAFSNKLKEKIQTLRLGSFDGKLSASQSIEDNKMSIDIGPLISFEQKESIEKQVQKTLELGARIVAQPKIPDTEEIPFYPVSVLENCSADSPLMKEEVFGPVICLIQYKNIEEAITIANNSSMGLSSSIWTKNIKQAKEIAKKLNAGSVMINGHLMSHGLAETPWGGFNDSGFGKTHSVFGLEEMCRIKTIINDTLAFRKRNIFWHPYSSRIYTGLESILSVLYETSLWKKLKAIPKLLAIFLSYFRRD